MTLRMDRVASLLKDEIGMYFTREYRDASYGFITVTEVHMSPDLRIAKIYVSIFGDEDKKAKTMKMLEDRKSEIRAFIGHSVRLKFTPEVHIFLDDTLDRVEKINNIIKQIHKDDKA